MNTIKRVFIGLTSLSLIIVPSLIHALSFDEPGIRKWQQDLSGLYYVESEGGEQIRAIAFNDTENGVPEIVLHVKDEDCAGPGASQEVAPGLVNGVSIRLTSTCIAAGAALLAAKTKDGSLYVHNQFLTASQVEVGNGIFTFSTIGYREIYSAL